jgi:hypothetical protein
MAETRLRNRCLRPTFRIHVAGGRLSFVATIANRLKIERMPALRSVQA